MKYAEIRKFDVSNAPGVRTTLFVSGCTHNCKGCFNKDLQDFNYGDVWSNKVEDKIISYLKNDNIVGLNILGGEPLQQIKDNDLIDFLKRVKIETNKNIWLWSGYLFEEILRDLSRKIFLDYIDVLIDGKFDISKRDISLKYRGSSNQRVIEVQKSLKENQIVLYK
ncbi:MULTISPECIES: anaerobic ribonucleoside-triphosphate reductase activating protein [unclassified Clostridioides]|uniref:anaerobic ribonucleoside-triphosphate reductase activating protein n=1 Tax=unclassified Clostridioides TaxID=2635829 RepID=UPI001D101D3D|nr:anaerobic ribonucleoside-triphosphate reductase activating protein [Clostridioides sp. ES-S-0049-03]MCC0678439.1 anaerobic ribonucleoside-triphosphate reductase activating protein [Clostridioides sp. ES-W-0018-02]MCC0682508.1 anaerobic ribonucleoside-triphosphate reductase activating protein [Clostridioides sp. ES-S-0005-03]MCC0707236.1 anaerobic ribonucleoside-triphosphate reductase activating protein [Clostridioides sp. ES-S-0190-01]MCC0713266.1 anaerobic ribonucleoside-triphosphate reduct